MIATSIEQSKRLVELGLNPKTADMYYNIYGSLQAYSYDDGIKDAKLLASKYSWKEKDTANKVVPAWSLTALINLLPSDFTIKGKLGTFTYEVVIRKYRFTADIDIYQIAYGNYGINGNSWHDMINTSECENPLDSTFEMICWLLKNNKL